MSDRVSGSSSHGAHIASKGVFAYLLPTFGASLHRMVSLLEVHVSVEHTDNVLQAAGQAMGEDVPGVQGKGRGDVETK